MGDFEVRRALPQQPRRFVGPFCFLDHMGPHTSVGTADGGVGPHPHIGLATITYLFEGEALHRDSLSNQQLITPGDVNWMSAGRGIAHSERTPPHLVNTSYTMHGLQMWVALPLDAEESAPSFQHVARRQLPKLEAAGVSLTVVLGEWQGSRSPVQLASPTFYVVAELEPGATLDIPTQYSERAFYVVDGELELDGDSFLPSDIAFLNAAAAATCCAKRATRVAVLGGEPLEGPRFMWWNFVSSRKERIEQAKDDWRNRRFALIPGDSEARIPMPGE